MDALVKKLKRADWANWTMFLCMVALIAFGAMFICSAGSSRTSVEIQNLWKKHVLWGGCGIGIFGLLAMSDYRKLLDWTALPGYVLACFLLVAVLVFGVERYGGRRWLWSFQPSEMAKLAVLLFIAQTFGRKGRERFRWFLAALAIVGGPALLILAEPDLGTTLVLVPAATAMLLAARVWTKGLVTLLLAGLLAAGLVLGTVYVAENTPDPERREQIYARLPLKEHQLQRLRVFLFPDRDIHGAGYNLRQAEISIGSGSLWGKGLKEGSMKSLGYLPPKVAVNDFIFAVLAEESGFMGAIAMLALYLGVLLPGVKIAFSATDDRGRLLAIGITTLVFCHAYVNVAMSIGLMPITGLPLPFISSGRTFLLVAMAGLGIVQSVGIHRDEEQH